MLADAARSAERISDLMGEHRAGKIAVFVIVRIERVDYHPVKE